MEYAYFSAFVMSHLPWFANVNGAQRRVMWGNPSPYPAVNIINGKWVADTERLRRGDTASIVRPPVELNLYFQGEYGVATRGANKLEKTHAFLINNWVRRRGFRGGLYFEDRRKIEAERYQQYQATNGQNFIGNEQIQNPLRRKKKARLCGQLTKRTSCRGAAEASRLLMLDCYCNVSTQDASLRSA